MCENGHGGARGIDDEQVSAEYSPDARQARIEMTDAARAITPQADILQLSSVDMDEVRTVLNRFFYPITVGAPDGADDFELTMQVIQLGPLTIGQLGFGGSVTLDASELDGYHVTMPMIGNAHVRQGRHEVFAGPATAAVFRPGQPVYSWHGRHSSELDVKIAQPAL